MNEHACRKHFEKSMALVDLLTAFFIVETNTSALYTTGPSVTLSDSTINSKITSQLVLLMLMLAVCPYATEDTFIVTVQIQNKMLFGASLKKLS